MPHLFNNTLLLTFHPTSLVFFVCFFFLFQAQWCLKFYLFYCTVDEKPLMGCSKSLCINSSVVERERWVADGGGTMSRSHTDGSISAPSPCLSAVTGNRPGLRQLDLINSPAPSVRALLSTAILPNGRAEFADLLREKKKKKFPPQKIG